MHARELVELAALVSLHGPVLIRGTGKIPKTSVEGYWTASKCRLDRWARTLKRLSSGSAGRQPRPRRSSALLVRGVLEEILTGEVLTRVWTAVMSAYDRHRGTSLMEPVARSVLVSHLEARHRLLTLLVRGPGIDAEQAVRLNRLRRRTERWADVLVGYLGGPDQIGQFAEFAVNPDRAEDFAEDLDYQSRQQGERHVWPLVFASLRAAFRRGLAPVSPNADLNAKIAESIFCCFQPELFDSAELFRSAWLMRISHLTDDAQRMIDKLLALEQGSSAARACVPGHRSDRLRRLRGNREA